MTYFEHIVVASPVKLLCGNSKHPQSHYHLYRCNNLDNSADDIKWLSIPNVLHSVSLYVIVHCLTLTLLFDRFRYMWHYDGEITYLRNEGIVVICTAVAIHVTLASQGNITHISVYIYVLQQYILPFLTPVFVRYRHIYIE